MTESNPYKDLIERQDKYFREKLRHVSLFERKKHLKSIYNWIKNNEQLIIDAVYADLKKCEQDVLLSEIRTVISEIKDARRNLRFWAAEEKKSAPISLLGTKAWTQKEPKGKALIIAPWNFPFQLAIGPMVSAIAAGCTITLKPSEHTPATEKLISRMVGEIFRPEHVQVVTGGVSETTHLLNLKWDHIFFTGSPQVGKIVMKAAAQNLTSVTLELGGENPVIIDETANIKDTAQKLIWGKMFNGGQSCVSPNTIFVHQSKKQTLIDQLKKELNNYLENKPSIETNHFPRIVNENHSQRIDQLINKSIEEGAKKITNETNDITQSFIAPTLLELNSIDASICDEEIFGPVLPILEYNDLRQVLEVIEKREKPLAFYIFSKRRKNIDLILKNSSAGTTVINDTTIQFTHQHLPFGGVNGSGIGKAHGVYGYKEFTNERAVLKQRRGWTMPKLIYPPYGKFQKFLIRFVTWRL